MIKDVTVQINSAVKYKLNGNEFIPKNVDGSKMDTLIYNGRSYVPLRAIADAFKVAVDWDGATSTIILGEREGKGVSLLDLKPRLEDFFYDTEYLVITSDKDALTFHGDTEVVFNFGIDSVSKSKSATKIFVSLEKKFQTLKFYTWTTDNDGKLVIWDTTNKSSIELKRFDIPKNELKEIEVNVGGVDSLLIEFGGYNKTKFVIAELYLK
ncbi:stalk domain-containing protein [Acetivibrio clariflavus]|uniref:stalk domain-containing protein n=1 Tax=Acetivibrio clariflavus TaxID=288965 RepID=UPI0031F4E3D0